MSLPPVTHAKIAADPSAPAAIRFPRQTERLFSELTGLELSFLSAPPPALTWDPSDLIAACRPTANPHRVASSEACRRCAGAHLERALRSRRGHRFAGACGAKVFLLPMTHDREVLGLTTLVGGPASRGTAAAAGNAAATPRRFDRAAKLATHFSRELELAHVTAQRDRDLARVEQALASHEREELWLRRALKRTTPALRRTPAEFSRETRAARVVGTLQARVQREFHKPLALGTLARELGMNASYLSSQFARTTGMPFKTYLTTMRLQQAQQLLRDSRRRISEIAAAVGYASAERFRAAFRQRTGLSPRRWRETLRVG